MILIMKEMENMIEENIISSPHMISLWYDWKDNNKIYFTCDVVHVVPRDTS